MDKVLEKKIAEEIRKKLALSLKNFDFKRTKPTFYTSLHKDRINFVHLHKFTFGPCFRVHIGSRILCDSFDAVALNGINSDSYRPNYKLEYGTEEDSVHLCVSEMNRFIQTEGFKWFEKWSSPTLLLNTKDSIIAGFSNEYVRYINGEINEGVVNQSYKILGIKR
jgi:hypothetical protein